MSCENVPEVPNAMKFPTEDSVICGTKVTYTCNEGLFTGASLPDDEKDSGNESEKNNGIVSNK